MKIAHISDTHIHNLKDHQLYKGIFEELYKQLKQEKVECIVHTGDIYHNKISLSPEVFKLAGDFFNNLASIAPTFCILGNHDCLVLNSERLDSISPLKSLIKNPNFNFLKDSGVYSFKNINFIVHSVLDNNNFQEFEVEEDKINIALYHGIVSGLNTIEKYQQNKISYKYFEKFDYTFLGDIHESNLTLDSKGKIRYPGSTIQQNFGEDSEKGYLIWDIQDKDNYTCEFKKLSNKRPFITIRVNKGLKLDDFQDYPKDAKIRIVNESDLDNVRFRKLANGIKNRFKFKNVIILEQLRTENVRKIDQDFTVDDLHDIATHEKLLKNFFKEETAEILEEILNLNKIYFNKLVTNDFNKSKNWKIDNLSWSNLFNYGEKNYINFNSLEKGVIGIFGKNRSGKSSVIDSLLFSLFNKISKNLKGNQEIINSSKSEGSAEVQFSIGEDKYKIIRKLGRSKNNKSTTNLEFYINNIINNDSSRTETDKIIQTILGTLDSFLLTSVSSQFGFNNFIDEGSTKRKEILANFLELEIFDKLFEEAKEDFVFLKNMIKKMEVKNFNDTIKAYKEDYESLQLEKNNIEENLLSLQEQDLELQKEITILENLYKNLPKIEFGSDKVLIQNISKLESEIADGKSLLNSKRQIYIDKKEQLKNIKNYLNNIDIKKIQDSLQESRQLYVKLEGYNKNLEILKIKKQQHEKNVSLLDDVPCRGTYDCKFLSNANKSKVELQTLLQELAQLEKNILEVRAELSQYNLEELRSGISAHQDASRIASDLDRELPLLFSRLENSVLQIKNKNSELDKARAQLETYKNLQNSLEELNKLQRLKENKTNLEFIIRCEGEKNNKIIEQMYKIKNNLEKIEEEKNNYAKLIKDFSVFEKYMKAIGTNGIRYSIIKDKLKIINNKLKSYLDNIADFEVMFEDADNNLNINVKDSQGIRAINMCSGSEKSLASMAVRLSLLSVSNLPRSNVFILDEPATALDADNMEGFSKILEMIKQDFSLIFLISHIDALKDMCDDIITIENDDGFAKIIIQ